jgi:hypothetical protein
MEEKEGSKEASGRSFAGSHRETAEDDDEDEDD